MEYRYKVKLKWENFQDRFYHEYVHKKINYYWYYILKYSCSDCDIILFEDLSIISHDNKEEKTDPVGF